MKYLVTVDGKTELERKSKEDLICLLINQVTFYAKKEIHITYISETEEERKEQRFLTQEKENV